MNAARSSSGRPRLLVAVTASVSCALFRGQLAFARRQGFDVALLASPGPMATRVAEAEGATLIAIPISRGIAPLADCIALVRVCVALLRFRPAVVNAGTPKAGCLVTIAAWLCRVPCRIYHLRGLYWETSTGRKRAVFSALERIVCRAATGVLCDSPSLRARAIALGLVRPERSFVLGLGSSNGVDLVRFARRPELLETGRRFRMAAGIPPGAPVVGFVGRVAPDKGIAELVDAWTMLRREFADAHLLVVGAMDGPSLSARHLQVLESDPRVHLAGGVDTPESYYAALDLLVLPTYREGFGNVLIEAAAMELPVVATKVTGCVDAVEEGVTGTLVPAADARALAEAIRRYLGDEALRLQHGRAGRERVERSFGQQFVWDQLHAQYARLLRDVDLQPPEPVVAEPMKATTIGSRVSS